MGKTALPGAKRLNAFAMKPDALAIVGLDTADGPEHPLYDERIHMPLDEGLVRNVRKFGVIESVSVRKNGHLVEVVAGRQRVRAAREVNRRNAEEGLQLILVPVFVKRPRGDSDALGIMISENENRRDDDPLTRANKASRLMDFGATEEDIAIAFGISKPTVKNLLSLLELSDKVKGAVQQKQVSFSAAIELRDLPRAKQDEKLSEMITTGTTGVSEAKRQRRSRTNGKSASPRGRAVGIKTLRKVAENAEFIGTLSPDARAVLQWILGDESAAERIDGLADLIKK